MCMFASFVCSYFFFFFQAEDGIRDHCVTGVQTCALPILSKLPERIRLPSGRKAARRTCAVWPVNWRISWLLATSHRRTVESLPHDSARVPRSEEHTSELQSHSDLVCRLLPEKKNATNRVQ